jgi:hypothetical protein
MRSLFLSIFIILSTIHGLAQSFRKNDIYGELFGNGMSVSVNYERQTGKKPGLGLRIGLGYASGDQKFRVSIPVGINYLFDLGNHKSFIETGLGVTWAEQEIWKNAAPGEFHQYSPGFIPSVGYRHHTPYHLMWRINYTPFFTKYRSSATFIGISVGLRI